jgi:hypothetical protein
VRWLLRFFLWATVLSLPCWLLADAYHHALAAATLRVLGIRAPAAAIPPPDIPASHVLGVFSAMCLASTRASWGRRLAAMAAGLAGLMLLEWLTGVAAVAWMMRDTAPPGGTEFIARLRDNLTSLPAWIGAPVLWLALLGDRELPATRGHGGIPKGAAPAGPRSGSPGGAR